MKTEARERGTIEGFRRADDGWHVVKFMEGIDFLKDKDGKISQTDKGDKRYKFPMVVDDVEDDSNEIEIDAIATANKRGEQMVTDFLGATGLFAAFAKAFPGDVSVFEDKVFAKVQQKLPGQFMRVKTQQNEYVDKGGKKQIAVNLIGFGKMSDKIEDLEKELFPAKEGKGEKSAGSKGKKEEKVETPDEEF